MRILSVLLHDFCRFGHGLSDSATASLLKRHTNWRLALRGPRPGAQSSFYSLANGSDVFHDPINETKDLLNSLGMFEYDLLSASGIGLSDGTAWACSSVIPFIVCYGADMILPDAWSRASVF